MIAVTRILVPIDFSEASGRALEFARVLADTWGASLHLLHVIGYPVVTPGTVRQERLDSSRRLDALLDATDRSARHATTSCEVGTPAAEIVRYATNHAIDLVVMGTHRHGPTFRMATGSIAERVVAEAPCAVLTVKGQENSRPLAFDPVVSAALPS
jgi:nucleotide-binding universal stress UspA family protein